MISNERLRERAFFKFQIARSQKNVVFAQLELNYEQAISLFMEESKLIFVSGPEELVDKNNVRFM